MSESTASLIIGMIAGLYTGGILLVCVWSHDRMANARYQLQHLSALRSTTGSEKSLRRAQAIRERKRAARVALVSPLWPLWLPVIGVVIGVDQACRGLVWLRRGLVTLIRIARTGE